MCLLWLRGGVSIQGISDRYKQIEGFSKYYITDTGKVYSTNRKVANGGLMQLKPKGRFDPRRYLQVVITDDAGEQKYMQIHSLVAKHFCEGYFPGAIVNHIDGNKWNNDYRNLEWVTQRDNIRKSYITSGVNQVRNFNMMELIAPNGVSLGIFIGRNKAFDYIRKHNLDTSCSSLSRNGRSKGYILRKVS